MQKASPLPARTRLAARAGKTAASVSRHLGRGEGSVIGGRVTLALDKHALQRLAAGRVIALVSGTNGKTTTTSMLTVALNTFAPAVTNLSGANMYGGMVSALSDSKARLAVLETDEGHLPTALAATKAQFVVLLNLSRDQLDRVGEVRMQAQKWREALSASTATVIANADDPIVVWAAQAAKKTVWVAGSNNWRLDAASCPNCGHRIDWPSNGEWKCTSCGLARPDPHAFFAASQIADHRSDRDIRVKVDLQLPGQINRANAAIALTTAVLMGADAAKAAEAVNQLEGVAGRFTSTSIAGTPVRLLLAKNPAGWTEALRIARTDSPLVVSINARVQDGRDPSWLWDVPYEQLQGCFVGVTGERGRDLSVRLKYANVEHGFFEDPTKAVKAAARRFNGDGEIDVIGNYSAFQDFRKLAGSGD